MPSIYSRHKNAFFAPSSFSGNRLVPMSGSSSLSSSSSEYRRHILGTSTKGSGHTSIVSSDRSIPYHQGSIRSNPSTMTRNERGLPFLTLSSTTTSSGVEDDGKGVATSRDPPETDRLEDTSNDWGYFVDCDNNFPSDRQPALPPTLMRKGSLIRAKPIIYQRGRLGL